MHNSDSVENNWAATLISSVSYSVVGVYECAVAFPTSVYICLMLHVSPSQLCIIIICSVGIMYSIAVFLSYLLLTFLSVNIRMSKQWQKYTIVRLRNTVIAIIRNTNSR